MTKLHIGAKIHCLTQVVWCVDEITLRADNFVTLRKKKKKKTIRGLDVGKSQKWPCQHLDPEFRHLSTLKQHQVYSEVGTISIIAITLNYVFALLHNALYLWRIVIASDSYCFRLFGGVIAYNSYCSELAGQRYRFTSLSFWATYPSIIASREVAALIWR